MAEDNGKKAAQATITNIAPPQTPMEKLITDLSEENSALVKRENEIKAVLARFQQEGNDLMEEMTKNACKFEANNALIDKISKMA